jgi:hypothetical protein
MASVLGSSRRELVHAAAVLPLCLCCMQPGRLQALESDMTPYIVSTGSGCSRPDSWEADASMRTCSCWRVLVSGAASES